MFWALGAWFFPAIELNNTFIRFAIIRLHDYLRYSSEIVGHNGYVCAFGNGKSMIRGISLYQIDDLPNQFKIAANEKN